MSSSKWDVFLKEASLVMRAALKEELSLEEASAFFENTQCITDESLRQFLVRYIWEIDGCRDIYIDILRVIESQATEQDLLDYMSS